VRAMSRGELRPGDAQAMLKEGRSGMSDQGQGLTLVHFQLNLSRV